VAYILRVPFELSTSRDIVGIGTGQSVQAGNISIEIRKGADHFLLEAKEFTSEAEARTWFDHLAGAMAWLCLDLGIAAVVPRQLGTITLADDPMEAAENLRRSLGLQITGPVHGLGDGNLAVIYPSDKVIRFIRGGSASLIAGAPISRVLAALAEGISLQRKSVEDDPKLKTALDVFTAHWFETSASARFLTLIMSIEVLSQHARKPASALRLLAQWNQEVEAVKQQTPSASEEYAAFVALQRELLFRKEASIRSQFRLAVKYALESVHDSEAVQVAEEAVDLYDKRSVLVHEGTLPTAELNSAVERARAIAERVLRARFRTSLAA
jgi:hypothetical protein